MHEGDARGANEMSFHVGRGGECRDLYAEFRGSAVEVGAVGVVHDKRAATEFFPCTFKWLLGCFDGGILQLIAQCGKRRFGVIVDSKNYPLTFHAAWGASLRYVVHRHIKNFAIGHARDLHVKKLAEGPSRVVIRSFL